MTLSGKIEWNGRELHGPENQEFSRMAQKRRGNKFTAGPAPPKCVELRRKNGRLQVTDFCACSLPVNGFLLIFPLFDSKTSIWVPLWGKYWHESWWIFVFFFCFKLFQPKTGFPAGSFSTRSADSIGFRFHCSPRRGFSFEKWLTGWSNKSILPFWSILVVT